MLLFLLHLRQLNRIKHVLTALLSLFLQEFSRQNPLRASRKMKGNGCSLPVIKHYTRKIMINSITYCLFLLETCLNGNKFHYESLFL